MNQENLEFIALFKASGWSQPEAAKRLWKNRATINRYLNGKIVPEKTVLALMKSILSEEHPEKLTALKETSRSDWEDKLLRDLRPLHKDDRERVLKTIQAMIHGLPVRPPIHYELKPKCRDCGPKEN